jgi:hypothetical protein
MRIHIAAFAFLLSAGTLVQSPAFAEGQPRASLTLQVIDQNRSALPAASVTIFTLDGQPSQTVTANEKGVATFATLPAGAAQIVARQPGFAPHIEAIRLDTGANRQTVTLQSRKHLTSNRTSNGS